LGIAEPRESSGGVVFGGGRERLGRKGAKSAMAELTEPFFFAIFAPLRQS
jgi:hypothetical protein